MKKVLKYLILVIICSSLIFLIISVILNISNNMEKIKSLIEANNFIKVNVSVDKIMNCLKMVISAFLANVIGIIDILFKRRNKWEKDGIISIYIKNISIVKKEVVPQHFPIVEIDTGNSFVYITIEIKNISESVIKRISCQGVVVCNHILEPNQTTVFFIKLNKLESNGFNQKYKIKVFFSDINRKAYCCKANIFYDGENHCFNINYNKPKRRLKNGKNKDKLTLR